jgi:hypothetical protein
MVDFFLGQLAEPDLTQLTKLCPNPTMLITIFMSLLPHTVPMPVVQPFAELDDDWNFTKPCFALQVVHNLWRNRAAGCATPAGTPFGCPFAARLRPRARFQFSAARCSLVALARLQQRKQATARPISRARKARQNRPPTIKGAKPRPKCGPKPRPK